MALLKRNPKIDALARELREYTGESETQAIIIALQERIAREQAKRLRRQPLKDDILRIGRECAALPVLDNRPAAEILGYDQLGLPN